jgi:NitT/TauT family transport system substrate-binding protein
MRPTSPMLRRAAVAFGAGFASMAAVAAAEPLQTITIGMVPSLPAAATYIAQDKGWYRELGIEVEIGNVDSAAGAMSLVAANRLQVVEGGLASNYWNALAQGLPVIMASERGSSPLHHAVMVRNDLKGEIKTIADLKGRRIAIVAPGAILAYELGKTLETAGLSYKDVEITYIPFPQMGLALTNKAVDAAVSIPPFSDVALAQNLGWSLVDPDQVITPTPMAAVAYVINSDWASAHRDLAHKFFLATARGIREYCQAYHNGPNRQYVVDLLLKNGVSDRDVIDKYPWPSRDPNGRMDPASVLDIQDWFFKEGFIKQKFPIEKLVDVSYAEAAAQQLGTFVVENKASQAKGCGRT